MSPLAALLGSRTRAHAGRRGGSVLVVVAALLMASVLVRLSSGVGSAVAGGIGTLVSAASASSPGRETEKQVPEALLSALREREARVAAAEARLAERERAIELGAAEVQRGLEQLNEAEARLRELLTIADTAAEEDVARLTAIYEAMKPAEAAALFDKMDPGFAAGFLGRMRPDAAAQILAGLPADKAYALSVVLAGRNVAAVRD